MTLKILLSAGHNPGVDSGALGQGQQEANDNVRITDRVDLYLRSWGIDTIYQPNNIGDLQAEINNANATLKVGEGYAIQIHRNAGGGTGNEVWTTAYKNQIPLAKSILNAMTSITGLPSRGVKDIKTSNWPLGWINFVNAESVLIEARFIDRDSITDADDMLDAYAIACGIADFLGVPRRPSVEQQQIIDSENARALQEAAKAEAARLAAIEEQARIEAYNASQALLQAEAEAKAKRLAEEKRLADEKALAEAKAKAEAELLAANTLNQDDRSFVKWLKNIFIEASKFLTGWRK